MLKCAGVMADLRKKIADFVGCDEEDTPPCFYHDNPGVVLEDDKDAHELQDNDILVVEDVDQGCPKRRKKT